MGGRGSAETAANSDWRLATGERQRVTNSEWRIVNGFDHPPEVGGYYLGCALRVES
jgi:hypothetical protein